MVQDTSAAVADRSSVTGWHSEFSPRRTGIETQDRYTHNTASVVYWFMTRGFDPREARSIRVGGCNTAVIVLFLRSLHQAKLRRASNDTDAVPAALCRACRPVLRLCLRLATVSRLIV